MKRNAVIAALFIAALFFSGCLSNEQRAENESNCRQAEKNAEEYIMDKYGLDAEVIDSEIAMVDGLFPSFSSYAYVEMKHEDESFTVYIDGSRENINGKDDFQKDKIEAFVKERISTVADIECSSIFIYNSFLYNSDSENIENYKLLYNTYFDGSNIHELTEECNFKCTISTFCGENLSALGKAAMEEIFAENHCAVFSYKEDTPTEKWYDQLREMTAVTASYKDYEYDYAPYIHEAVMHNCDNTEYSYFKPDVRNAGNILYLTENGSELDIRETIPEKNTDENICSKAYSIPRTDEKVWVYYQRDELPEYGENCGIAGSWLTDEGSREYSLVVLTDTAGEYLVKELEPVYDDYYCVVLYSGNDAAGGK
ncbi:MAG: hypothetical protein J6B17_00790 [Ruminococcus sp.]|nr:hypothetical protein [Ruminococcus sp.]